MTSEIKAQLETVDGLDVLDAAPDKARSYTRRFYTDELELLLSIARKLREREKHFIAPTPDGDGYAIFYKAAPAKARRTTAAGT